MEANELMIGDWVWYNNQPHQIRQLGIFGENRDGDDYPAVCVGKPNGIGLILERNEIEPIPLTPEILEKNGFVLDDEWYIYTGKGINIEVAFRDDNKFVYDLSILTGSGSMDIHANYIYELQHALRLCGIEKEIIL